jgi:hypothetical protein
MVNRKRIENATRVVDEVAKASAHYVNRHTTGKVLRPVLESDDELLFGEEAVERAAGALEAASINEEATYDDLVRAVIEALKNEDPPQEEDV